MKRKKLSNKKESGLAHFGVIAIAIIAIAAVALGGWWVWDKNKDENKTNNPTTQNNNQEEQKQSDPSEGGKYLVIKEWGVRFELPTELRGGVEYGIFTTESGEQSANFAIKEIDQLPKSNCGLKETTDEDGSGKYGGVVSVQKTREAPEEYSKNILFSFDSKAQINNDWYYVFPMRDSCFSAQDDEFALLMNKIDMLADAVGKLELVQ